MKQLAKILVAVGMVLALGSMGAAAVIDPCNDAAAWEYMNDAGNKHNSSDSFYGDGSIEWDKPGGMASNSGLTRTTLAAPIDLSGDVVDTDPVAVTFKVPNLQWYNGCMAQIGEDLYNWDEWTWLVGSYPIVADQWTTLYMPINESNKTLGTGMDLSNINFVRFLIKWEDPGIAPIARLDRMAILPEPATMCLLAAGGLALVFFPRRRR